MPEGLIVKLKAVLLTISGNDRRYTAKHAKKVPLTRANPKAAARGFV